MGASMCVSVDGLQLSARLRWSVRVRVRVGDDHRTWSLRWQQHLFSAKTFLSQWGYISCLCDFRVAQEAERVRCIPVHMLLGVRYSSVSIADLARFGWARVSCSHGAERGEGWRVPEEQLLHCSGDLTVKSLLRGYALRGARFIDGDTQHRFLADGVLVEDCPVVWETK